MGDLLRNFGPYGVPLGMILLGILIRFLYSSLVEGREFEYWRAVVYYMLLTSISYESFYGSILPYFIKVAVISVLGVLVLRFFIGKTRAIV
jgi:ABC-type multidrug transport system permease subunit